MTTATLAAPTVQCGGKATATFAPTTARMRVRLFAHGLSAASAMQKLTANQAYLKSEVARLDDLQPTLTVGPIFEKAKQEGNIQAVMMAQMMGNDDKPEIDPRLNRMVCTVTLDWPLPDGDGAERYDCLDKIRLQLQRLGLSDKNVDESGADSRDDASDDTKADAKAGDDLRLAAKPRYYFARILTESEMQQAATDAFADGKRTAERLAKAAGMKLGDLVSISTGIGGQSALGEIVEYQTTMQAMFGESQPTAFSEDDHPTQGEISQGQLRPMTYTYSVQLSFELK